MIKISSIFRRLKYNKDGLATVAILNGISSFIKILTSFVTTKIVAAVLGPSGIALMGQLTNFLSFLFAFSSGGINGGVVRYIAEFKDNKRHLNFYISTSFYITLFFSSLFSLLVLIFSSFLSVKILYSAEYSIIFNVIAFFLIFYAFNSIIISIVNGLKDFYKYTYINIASSCLTLIISVCFVILFNIKGALIGLIVSQSIILFVSLYFIRKDDWFSVNKILYYFNTKISLRLLKYSLMAISTAILVPAAQLLIRSYVINEFSLEKAGIWEGVNKVSSMYLTVVTTTLGIYFLPKFSETKNNRDLKIEVLKAFKIVFPALCAGCLVIYFLKDVIIDLVFTNEFNDMKFLFKYQLPGDIMKIMSWILGTLMVSKAMYKEYIFFEIFTNSLLYLSSTFLTLSFGMPGLCIGYFITSTITFILMVVVFRKLLFRTS